MSDTLTAGGGKFMSPRAARGKTSAKVLTLPGPSYKRPSGMMCARRPAGARRPALSTPASSSPAGSPQRPEPRPGRARLSRFLPALALLLGAFGLFTAAPAQAQTDKVPVETGSDTCNGANVRLTRASAANNDSLVVCDGANWQFAVTANATGRCTETRPLFRDRTLRYCGSGANNGEPIDGINAVGYVLSSSPTPACSAAGFGTVHLRQADRSSKIYYCNGSTWVAVSLIATFPDYSPSFGAATVEDQQYAHGVAIDPLVLPAAEGGDGTLTYTLATLPAGLVFTAATRTLSARRWRRGRPR